MVASCARLIELLELLQTRRAWTGAQLAHRLGVSTRTVRTNIAQLRDLGFPVQATPGAAGGYELGAGSRMAPLVLEDDEAIATAVALRTAASTGVIGIEEASVHALAKLAQVLPDRLRQRVAALQDTIEPLRWSGSRSAVTSDAVLVFSQACRDRVQVRFDYVDRAGTATRREVEPYALVPDGARWYLVAFDLDRDDWRTFRVDRTEHPRPLRRRARTRALPDTDAASYVRRSIADSRPRQRAVVRFDVDVDTARAAFGGRPPGELQAEGPATCRLEAATGSLDWFAFRLALTDLEFVVEEPADFTNRVAELAARFARAATAL